MELQGHNRGPGGMGYVDGSDWVMGLVPLGYRGGRYGKNIITKLL